jgi:hypothetical protein
MQRKSSRRFHGSIFATGVALAFASFVVIRVCYRVLHIDVAPGWTPSTLWFASAFILSVAVGYSMQWLASSGRSRRPRFWMLLAMVISVLAMIAAEIAITWPEEGQSRFSTPVASQRSTRLTISEDA